MTAALNPASKGTTYVVIVGSSKPIEGQVLEDREPKDCTGIDIDIEFKADIDSADVAGVSIAWTDAATGKYEIDGAGDLDVGSYGYRITLTVGSNTGYAPNGAERDVIRVVAV